MELFHGTSSHFLKEVFEHGLLPGRAREDKWHVGWSARPDLVYLTDYGAAYYAVMSAARMPKSWQDKLPVGDCDVGIWTVKIDVISTNAPTLKGCVDLTVTRDKEFRWGPLKLRR